MSPRALVAVVLLALALVGFGAGPAAAHAAVESTTPAAGAALDTAPATVSVRFSESVQATSDAIRVLDAHGARVDKGGAATEPGHSDTVAVAVRPGLAQGTYTVAWHVTSADSHPVHGAFAFAVGHTGAAVAPLADADRGATPEVTTLVHLARGVGYGGLALLIGAFGIGVLLDGGTGRAGIRRQAHAGALVLTVSAAVDLLAQGPYAAGSGLGSLFDPALLHDTLSGRTGIAEALRVVLAAGLTLALGAGSAEGHETVPEGPLPGTPGTADGPGTPATADAPEAPDRPQLTKTAGSAEGHETVPEGPLPGTPGTADGPGAPATADAAETTDVSVAEPPAAADVPEPPAAEAVEAHGAVTGDPAPSAPEAAEAPAVPDATEASDAAAAADIPEAADTPDAADVPATEAPHAAEVTAPAPGTGRGAGTASGARTALPWARVAPYAPFPLLVALAATFSATSHAATGRHAPVAFLMDLLHLMAMGLWLGGLVALAALCTSRAVAADPETPAAFTTAVRRFSPLAAWCVGVLVVTGTLQAVRLLGSVEDMVTTGWGRYLTVKLTVILVLLALARTARGWTHRYAPGRRRTEHAKHVGKAGQAECVEHVEHVGRTERSEGAGSEAAEGSERSEAGAGAERSDEAGQSEGAGRPGDSGPDAEDAPAPVPAPAPAANPLRTMRRTLAAEACVGVVVLALSTMLASSAPPADRVTAASGAAPTAAPTASAAPAAPAHLHAAYDTGGAGGSGTAVAVVTPQADGTVSIDLTLTSADGSPAQPVEFTAALSLPSLNIGPLPLDLDQSGPGHWQTTTTPTPKGKWQLALTIRTSDVDETTVTFPATAI